jgi:hypothetical protein
VKKVRENHIQVEEVCVTRKEHPHISYRE